MTYTLFKNHHLCPQGRGPVLLTSDGCLGPYQGETVPDGCTSSARDIVMRAAAGEPRLGDPPINAEPGADLHTYMLEFLASERTGSIAPD